nr:sigma-54 dependent transcriptional regulator [Bacteroidales bacterium]
MDSQELQRLKNKYDIIGNDAALNRALETAVAVAPTDLTVLITGESGVGKENIPKIIHQNSRRKSNKYFAVNCGAIPEGTIDSELFGHEKGSFTGAIETRKGYFEEADGGTLFLDEIGELPLASQAKLLRVLQSGEFIKVGSSKVEKTDVRVIAATNVNLLHQVSKGKFREDLYYRLNAINIQMPALRERKEDIYLFFRKFTSDFSEKYGMGKVTLTNDAIDLLINYRWPGNIRQLKNVAETVTALESEKLTPTSERCVVDASTLS